MVILIFGDSITQGYWDDQGGWADRIKKHVMSQDIARGYKGYHGIFNLGVDGNFTYNVIDRFDTEVGARRFAGADANDDYAIIFAIGVNDTLHVGEGFQSTPEQYREELEALLVKARGLTSRVAFVNLLPIAEAASHQSTADKDLFYTNERIELFNAVLEDFCDAKDVSLIDVRNRFLDQDTLFSPDGTHPNSEGNQEIFSLVTPVVEAWISKV